MQTLVVLIEYSQSHCGYDYDGFIIYGVYTEYDKFCNALIAAQDYIEKNKIPHAKVTIQILELNKVDQSNQTNKQIVVTVKQEPKEDIPL